jgi:hypothetical protein
MTALINCGVNVGNQLKRMFQKTSIYSLLDSFGSWIVAFISKSTKIEFTEQLKHNFMINE